MNIKDAFKKAISGIGEQAKALPQYLSQQVTGVNPYEPGDISGPAARQRREDQPFLDKGLRKTETGSWTSQSPTATPTPTRVPMPPTQRPQVAGTSTTESTRGRNPKSNQVTMQRSVYDAIIKAADTYKVPRELMFDVAMAESTFNPQAKAYDPKSTSSGLFMFNDGTWKEAQKLVPNLPSINRNDPLSAAMAAAWYFKNGLLGRWDASKKGDNENAWGQWWNDDELKDYYPQKLDSRMAKQ